MSSLQCVVIVVPKNLMVLASSISFPFIFRQRLVCLFEGFLNSMYLVLAGFIWSFSLSHQLSFGYLSNLMNLMILWTTLERLLTIRLNRLSLCMKLL